MHDKIVFLAKSKLNEIEVLISKALLDSNISLVEFVLISNVLKEYQEMKEEIKNLKTQSKFIYKTMLSYCLRVEKIQKVKTRKMQEQKMEEYFIYQNVQRVTVRNQNSSNSKKLVDYYVR